MSSAHQILHADAHPLSLDPRPVGRPAKRQPDGHVVGANGLAAAMQKLIVEGECLLDTDDRSADDVVTWIRRAQEVLTRVFGHGHRFVVDVEDALQGADHPPRDPVIRLARYLRVLTLVVLSILRRAASDWHSYARL